MNRKELETLMKKGLTWARSLDRQTVIILLSITAALLLGVISTPFYIHYLQTRPIPLRFADEKTGYVYEGASNDITIRMADSKTNEPRVELSSGTSKLSFRITETKKNFTPAQKTGDQILFADIQPKTDISYKTLPNGIKEEIILREPSNKTAFLFDFQAVNAYPKVVMKGFYLPLFYDDKGKYLFHMLEPFAIDAKGKRTDDVRVQLTDGSEKGHYLFILSINESWLADPKRAYPITIDPTIVHSTSADFAGGTFNRAKDVGSGAAPLIETYYQQLAADQYTVGLWHMDEASGNVLDSSGNGNTGTPTGTSVVAGRIGNGRSFNGSSDYINTTYIPKAGAKSLSYWVYYNTVSTGDFQLLGTQEVGAYFYTGIQNGGIGY